MVDLRTVNVEMHMGIVTSVRMFVSVKVTMESLAQRPNPDSNQHHPDHPLGPRRELVERQNTSQQQKCYTSEDHTTGVTAAPHKSREPTTPSIVNRHRRYGRQVVWPRDNMDKPGDKASQR
jgi:hypothetical protein